MYFPINKSNQVVFDYHSMRQCVCLLIQYPIALAIEIQRLMLNVQLHPAIPDVKGSTHFICYWGIFVIANIENKKKWLDGTKV